MIVILGWWGVYGAGSQSGGRVGGKKGGSLGSDVRTGMETEAYQGPSSCGNAGRTHVVLGTLGREGQDSWAGKAYGILGSGGCPRKLEGCRGRRLSWGKDGESTGKEQVVGGANFLLEDKAGVLDAGLGAKREGRKRQSQNPRRRRLMAFGGSWEDWGTGCQGLEDLCES